LRKQRSGECVRQHERESEERGEVKREEKCECGEK